MGSGQMYVENDTGRFDGVARRQSNLREPYRWQHVCGGAVHGQLDDSAKAPVYKSRRVIVNLGACSNALLLPTVRFLVKHYAR